MKKAKKYLNEQAPLIALIAVTLVALFVNIKINVFRYNNFDLGKFDLGNMTQMVWNASKGNGLWLTDYFGTNLPRWAMSHVDPILYLVVPFFILFPSPMTLIIFQLILVLFSSLFIYGIAKIHLKSKYLAFALGLAYVANPAIGYLTAWTAFHGVTVAIFFFLAAFYIFDKAYFDDNFTIKKKILFWVMLIITMTGKEQIPLYVMLYGFFILILRNGEFESFKDIFKGKNTRLAASMMIVGTLWFVTAFFIIIPSYAHYRIEGYEVFAKNMGLDDATTRDVGLSNYFLNRYEEFGDSYGEIFINILIKPAKSAQVFFGGDNLENFHRTFAPLGYFSFASPFSLLIALGDFGINYLTTAGGIGTSEITNHRVSMIIPVIFVSTILGIAYLAKLFKKREKIARTVMVCFVLACTLFTTHKYNNPAYLWFQQALYRKVVLRVFAKSDLSLAKEKLEIGDVVRLSELDDKDRECAAKIVKSIPDEASVSGPDSMGAHLSMRETYAIFPALYNSADYVIVDVFARKILTILDTDVEMVKNVVEDLIKDSNYELQLGCGNYFVFKNVGHHTKPALLPIQERFSYVEKHNYDFFQGVKVVDYDFPHEIYRGQSNKLNITFYRGDNGSEKDTSLEQYILFTTFINEKTGEMYQQANLASFAIKEPSSWTENRYYIENVEFVLPHFLDASDYRVFVGMGNKIRTRSIYLGDLVVK